MPDYESRWRNDQGYPRGDGRGRGHGRPAPHVGSYGGREHGRSGRTLADYRRGGGADRGFLERAGDEIASWFGDDAAEHRRRYDAGRGAPGALHHRGRGPRGYTRSDGRIREDVSDRLTDDTSVNASDIDVAVAGGDVTLNGTVDSRAAKRRAEDVAETVPGVRHVQNNLRVLPWTNTGTSTR